MRAPEITALLEALMGKLEKDRAVVLVRQALLLYSAAGVCRQACCVRGSEFNAWARSRSRR